MPVDRLAGLVMNMVLQHLHPNPVSHHPLRSTRTRTRTRTKTRTRTTATTATTAITTATTTATTTTDPIPDHHHPFSELVRLESSSDHRTTPLIKRLKVGPRASIACQTCRCVVTCTPHPHRLGLVWLDVDLVELDVPKPSLASILAFKHSLSSAVARFVVVAHSQPVTFVLLVSFDATTMVTQMVRTLSGQGLFSLLSASDPPLRPTELHRSSSDSMAPDRFDLHTVYPLGTSFGMPSRHSSPISPMRVSWPSSIVQP